MIPKKTYTLNLTNPQILGIEAQDFSTEQVIPEEKQYTGRIQCYVSEDTFKDFKKKGIMVTDLYQSDAEGKRRQPELEENEFVILKADQSLRKTHLGRVKGQKIVPLEYNKSLPYGIKPKNSGQYFLQEALMKPAEEAPLVIVKGQAGTAKTFYSLAVGLEKILNHPTGEYRRILICRPNAQFDTDIGFLPGDEQEKISPLMRPIMDNLEQLIDANEEERYQDEIELKGKIDEIFERNIIQTEALNFIRGRSFIKTYLIIDEAQNMTPNQIKGIITRAGKGTKIILLGDPNQIDKPFLDERTNGLSYASENMKGSPLCFQITMMTDECERSELAMDAIQRL
ncbi:PhoH family protein [Megasphaera cerevisiae]|jgi:PhoH-like ATPase|uniref:PhoH family protein n=1 Tax=Megasphaera cerevisiae TaxID=39029 RepID=UPI000999D98E|nr:PhoH family protein [Megasphaera cerevisiae]SKA18170.1 PhoH-like ATPase [Megasphaera cerevisiae DSM 20462]